MLVNIKTKVNTNNCQLGSSMFYAELVTLFIIYKYANYKANSVTKYYHYRIFTMYTRNMRQICSVIHMYSITKCYPRFFSAYKPRHAH